MNSETRRSPVPCITAEQMREVDRVATEEYGLKLLQMMENAGRHLAHLAREQFLGGDPRGKSVLVICGTGGNGGGGLVAARRLHGWGATVYVHTTKPPEAYTGVPAHQRSLLTPLDVSMSSGDADALPDADLLQDAMIGYGLDGEPKNDMAALIRQVIWHEAPVLSLDVPSGLNATTGVPSKTTVHADATLTLALPKCGLDAPAARPAVGDLFLADIGIPPSLYDRLDVVADVTDLFGEQDLIQLS